MELLGKNKNTSEPTADEALYFALAAGDLSAAYLIGKDFKEKNGFATAFNCGLCLFRLGEWEKALCDFKRAEQLAGNPPEYDISERKMFLKALEITGENTAFLPLDPRAPKKCDRLALIRIKRLIALCLKNLGREGEAAAVARFLAQYNIQI